MKSSGKVAFRLDTATTIIFVDVYVVISDTAEVEYSCRVYLVSGTKKCVKTAIKRQTMANRKYVPC
jgi:hypothetical protein